MFSERDVKRLHITSLPFFDFCAEFSAISADFFEFFPNFRENPVIEL